MIPLAISVVCILAATFAYKMIKIYYINPKKLERILRKQGYNGNTYKLYLGNDKHISKKMEVEALSKPTQLSHDHYSRARPFHCHTLKTHGEKCFMWNGEEAMVNVSEPKHMRQVLVNLDKFPKDSNRVLKKWSPGVARLNGQAWATRRKILNQAFHIEKLKLMVPAFCISSNELVTGWGKMVPETGSYELDVWEGLERLSADGISRAAFGSSYEEGNKIFKLISEQYQLFFPLFQSPNLRFVPTKENWRITEIDKELKWRFKGMITDRRNLIEAKENIPNDLLTILLETGLTTEEVIAECKTFYLAGLTTTSLLLAWTLILLGNHQDWQERARAEVLSVIGDDTPDFVSLSHLKTVNIILQEVLRLYPPIVEIYRKASEDVQLGDLGVVPKGVHVYLPILYVHLNEKIWGPDAKEFRPDRFSEGISKSSGGEMAYFPFAWGPRHCIGSNFAMTEAKLALVFILRRLSFQLSPSYVHSPVHLRGLQPEFGAQIIFRRLCE